MYPTGLAKSVGIRLSTNITEGLVVGIWDDFQPERKAELEDIAQATHDSVTMDEVLSFYSPSTPRRHHRCPCPIHNGKDFNFSYTEHGYKCFVCGASGDVIGFVKEVCELATRSDAMKRIDADFHLNLPINGTLSAIQSANLALKRKEAERLREAEQAWEDEYHRLTDEWTRLDRVRQTADPASEEYADAVKNIDFISFQLDILLCDKR